MLLCVPNLRDKAIPTLRDSLDIFAFARFIAQSFSQSMDDDIQIALFDYRIAPNAPEEFFLSDEVSATSNQESQSFKGLGGQRHYLIAP
jgi:hypothetical protein